MLLQVQLVPTNFGGMISRKADSSLSDLKHLMAPKL